MEIAYTNLEIKKKTIKISFINSKAVPKGQVRNYDVTSM